MGAAIPDSPTLTSDVLCGQCELTIVHFGDAGDQERGARERLDSMGMQPEKVGRVLGIGARVAAKTIRERAAQAQAAGAKTSGGANAGAAPKPAASPAPSASSAVRDASRDARAAAGQAAAVAALSGKKLARGAGRFGAAMVGPFARAGNILALQITGVFFALFAMFFLSHAAQTLHAAGRHDRHGQAYLGLGLVFAWFTVSSFWRARRKAKGSR